MWQNFTKGRLAFKMTSLALKTFLMAVILTVISLALAWLGRRMGKTFTGEEEKTLSGRAAGWLMLTAAVVIPAYLGKIPFGAAVSLLVSLSLLEFYYLFKGLNFLLITGGIFLGLVTCLLALIFPPHILYGFSVLLVLYLAFDSGRFGGNNLPRTRLGIIIFGILYVGFFLSHLIFIQGKAGGAGYITFLYGLVFFNDISAFFTGKFFGKWYLWGRLSPRKTLEGAIGGLIMAGLGALIFWYAVPMFSIRRLMLAAVLIGISAQGGDLFESYLKRILGVKDSGRFLPGHGGLLDRMDSFIFAAPAFYYFLLIS